MSQLVQSLSAVHGKVSFGQMLNFLFPDLVSIFNIASFRYKSEDMKQNLMLVARDNRKKLRKECSKKELTFI